MTTTEESRHRLYEWLERAGGTEVANTMMELLPPVGWGDVATNRDLSDLGSSIDRRFEQVDRRFEEIDRRFEEIDRRFEEIDRRFDQLEESITLRLEMLEANLLGAMHREMRLQLAGIVGMILAIVGAVLAVAAI